MSTIISIIKNAFQVWKDTTSIFWGSNGFSYFFFIALVIILFVDRDIIRKATYGGYTIIVLLGLYNPITYYLCRDLFNSSYSYFTRLYTLIPVPFIIAYACTFLIEKCKGIEKLCIFLFLIGVIILGGSNIYNEDWIQKAENYSNLPNDVVWICEMVHGYKDHVCVAAPSELAKDIRQYDGSIMMPYGRSWGDSNPLRKQLDLDNPEFDITTELVGSKACDFFIVKNNASNKETFSNLELFGNTPKYLIYSTEGIPRVERVFNEFSQIVEEKYLDENGNLQANELGYAAVKYDYYQNGYVHREYYLSDKEELVMITGNSGGYYGKSYDYDKKHRVKRTTYLGRDGKPIVSSFGYASIEYGYDDAGNKTSEFYYDEENKPISIDYGQFGVKKIYDSSRKMIKLFYVDADGNPIMTDYGYSILEREYDSAGNISGEYYYDENEIPILLEKGYAGKKSDYDESKRLKRITYVDCDHKPVNIDMGYAIITYEYNEDGSVTEIYTMADGTPYVLSKGENGQIKYKGEDGHTRRIIYIDVDKNPIINTSGYSIIDMTYDATGNVASEFYMDGDEKPIAMKQGYYGWNKTYNEDKKVTSVTYLDDNKRPKIINNSYATIDYNYDSEGHQFEEFYFDENGEPVTLSHGESGIRRFYNDNGKVNIILYLDGNGDIIETGSEYAVAVRDELEETSKKKIDYSGIKQEYNDKGNIIASYYIDQNEQLVNLPDGHCGNIRELREDGKVLSSTYVDNNGYPVELNDSGISKIVYKYLTDGKVYKKEYYNLNDDLIKEEDVSTWTVTQHSDDSNAQGMFYTIQNNISGTLIVIDGGMSENTEHVRQVIKDKGGIVDAWIVTHFHADHASAYNAIRKDPQGITIKKVYATKFDSDYDKFLEIAKDWDNPETMKDWMDNSYGTNNVYYPSRGESVEIENLKLTFLNTYDDKLLELNGERDLPNNCALVTLIEGREDSMLFMSDMYSEAVGDYLIDTYGERLKVKYLQPCHHGNSVMPFSFYEYIDPEVMFFDAPGWLMEDESLDAKNLKDWCDENGIRTYDFSSAPNEVELR